MKDTRLRRTKQFAAAFAAVLMLFALFTTLPVQAAQTGRSASPQIYLAATTSSANPLHQIDLVFASTEMTGTSSYLFYRSTSENGTYTPIGASKYNSMNYASTGLTPGTTYWYYTLRRDATTGKIITSNKVSATTAALPTANPQMQLSAAANGSNMVDLSYISTEVAGSSSYIVYRSTSQNGGYTQVTTRGYNTSGYTDTGLAENTTYWYFVTRVDATTGRTIQSNTVSVTTGGSVPKPDPEPTGPAAPNFWLSTNSNQICTVSWRYNAGYPNHLNPAAQPAYKIYYSGSPSGPWTEVSYTTGPSAMTGTAYVTLGTTASYTGIYNLSQYLNKTVYFKMAAQDRYGRVGPKSAETRWWHVSSTAQQDGKGLDSGWFPV